jgi:hypothetical protein
VGTGCYYTPPPFSGTAWPAAFCNAGWRAWKEEWQGWAQAKGTTQPSRGNGDATSKKKQHMGSQINTYGPGQAAGAGESNVAQRTTRNAICRKKACTAPGRPRAGGTKPESSVAHTHNPAKLSVTSRQKAHGDDAGTAKNRPDSLKTPAMEMGR